MNYLRLKEILKEKGITNKDLAQRVQITQNAMSFIVNGKRQPRFDLLRQIANALDVDIRDLFKGTKEWTKTIYQKNDKGEFVECGKIKV